MRRVLLLALAIFIAQTTLADIADAHYKSGRKRFTFSARSTNESGSKKNDPMNIFFHQWGTNGRVPRHLNAHWKPSWEHESEVPGRLGCKIPQWLSFRRTGADERFADDYQGVGPRPTPGVPDDCGHRYHARVWWDDHHRGGSHSFQRAWSIAGFHFDRFRVSGCCPPKPGHYTGIPWDVVEFRVQRKMRKRPESAHRDANGRSAGHCVNWRWRRLPGSRGYFGGNRNGRPVFSDGVATKVSMLHCRGGTRP